MKNLKSFALAAISLLGFAACQQVEISPEIKPEATHTVTFVAGAPETKTTVDINDGEHAIFAWTKADEEKFTVYENGTAAKETIGVLREDGKMTLTATFGGTSQGENSYVAILNKSGNATQIVTKEAYDEAADIMVSKAVSSFADESGVLLQFRREVAIAKMTLKGLDANENVSKITISSTSGIAGGYIASGWDNQQKSLELYSAYGVSKEDTDYKILANASGEAVVWFTCIPQDAATLTVKVEAADGDTYTKEFSRAISLSQGDVNVFGVAMVKDAPKTYGYQKISSVEEYAPGDYIIVAHAYKDDCPTKGDFAIANSLTISSDKISGTNVTSIIDNDVISVSDGDSYKLSLSGDKDNIVISNGTSKLGYGTSSTNLVLNGDKTSWSLSLNEGDGGSFILLNNSTASAKTKRALAFQCYSTSGTEKTASLKFAAYAVSNVNNADYAAIELYKYQEVTPPTPKYSIAFADVTGGTLSASPAKAEAGAEVTLTATPDKGYEFKNNWTVTNAKTSEAITVTGGKFTMPAADVNVTASFKQQSYAIKANPAENGTYTVKVGEKEVTSAVYGAKVLLEATPAEGYICDGWTVVDAESNPVSVSNNSFTMPASAVTISTTFSVKPEDITYDHAGTAEDPYSVADVLKYISTLGTATSESEVYAKGVISSITEVSTSYGNATYKIKDEGVENEVLVYRGLYLEGAKFTNASQIGVGDEVVVKGKVKNYDDTPEFDAKNQLVSIVKAPYLNVTASKESGIAAAGETVTITVDTNVDGWKATSDNSAFVVGTPEGNTVDVTVAENTGEERTATVTVTAGALSETITLTQKAASNGTKVDKTATITFGTNNVKINSESVTAKDNCDNSWTITTVGTTSFTTQPNYCQVGSSKKPATSITFTSALPSDAEVSSIEGKFGGFSDTAGTISLKVGETEIGSGSLNADSDVTVTSTKTAEGNVVTVSITGIAKGVKCYYIKVDYKTAE